MKHKVYFLILKTGITLAAFVWMFSKVDITSVRTHMTGIHWPVAGLSFLVSSIWLIPNAYRWKILADACGYAIRFKDAIRYYMIGSFFNVFLPTGKGGDVFRGLLASRKIKAPVGGVWGTILIERLAGLSVTLLLIFLMGSLFASRNMLFINIIPAASVPALGLILFIALFLSTKMRNGFKKLTRQIAIGRFHTETRELVFVIDTWFKNRRLILITLGLSAVNQLIQIISAYILSFAIPDFNVPFSVFLLVLPLSFISILLPSIGGYGVREAGMFLFLGWFGFQEGPIVIFCMFRILFLWIFAIMGSILYIYDHFTQKDRYEGSK